MKTMTVGEAVKLLEGAGFEKISQKGSHIKYRKGSNAVNIVMHRSTKENLSPGLEKNILATIEKSKQL